MKIAFVMLAAGNSRRFGSNKLLYEIEGKPMYLLTLEKLKKASEKIPESEIIVVTQYEEIVKKAGEMKIPVFINPRPEDGISLSMQIGLMSVRDTDACRIQLLRLQNCLKMKKREWPASDGMERLEIPAFLDRNITKN